MAADRPHPRAEPRLPRRRRRFWRYSSGTVLVLILLLVAARLALPSYLHSYVSRALARSPDYNGSVGTIGVSLWRGAYAIHDLKIVRVTNFVPVPFFESPTVHLALDWRALVHGTARG